MNKFILIPYDQYTSFKSYLMKKDDKQEGDISTHSEVVSRNSAEVPVNKVELTGDITDENKEQRLDNVNNRQAIDKKTPLPPPGIPVKPKNSEKLYHYGIRDEQEGAGTSKPKWVKKWEKKSSEIDSFLQEIYYDTRNPASFSSVEKLHKYIKSNTDKKISKKDIKIWLSKQESYTAHRPVRRRFKRPRVLAFYKNYQWDTDTTNMAKYKKQNDGYGYFAVFIDIFTQFLYTQPMKTLTGQEMVTVLKNFFQKSHYQPHILRSDQGSEYVNKEVANFLKRQKVKHIYTFYETKANYAERVIKTIKLKIIKYLTANGIFRWIDELDHLTYSYNNSKHRSIGMSPFEASDESKKYDLWQKQYGSDEKNEKNLVKIIKMLKLKEVVQEDTSLN